MVGGGGGVVGSGKNGLLVGGGGTYVGGGGGATGIGGGGDACGGGGGAWVVAGRIVTDFEADVPSLLMHVSVYVPVAVPCTEPAVNGETCTVLSPVSRPEYREHVPAPPTVHETTYGRPSET
jgi:hypothetical protein